MVDQVSPNALRALDDNGDPAGGALLYVYETGTTTPVTVYTDTALSSAHASPIVADGDGYFAQIFYGGTTALKIVVQDSDAVELQTIDPAMQIGITGGSASLIAFSPTAAISATNVQAAIEEVQGNVAESAVNAQTLVATAGASNTYTLTAASTITSYTTGERFLIRINHTNTGAATLNIDSLGAKNVQKYDSSNSLVALAAGDLTTGDIQEVVYDGTRFVILNNISAYGGMAKISETTISSDATIDLTLDTATYRSFRLDLNDVVPATDVVDLLVRLSTDGGSTFESGATDYANVATGASPSADEAIYLTLTSDIGSAAGEDGLSGTMTLHDPGNASKKTKATYAVTFFNSGGNLTGRTGAGARATAEAHDAVRFFMSSGSLESGKITLYGMK